MSKDNEYLTSNRLIRYPFADDSVILDGSDGQSDLVVFGCFVDAMVHMKSSYGTENPVISGISMSGHTISFTLKESSGVHPQVQLMCARSHNMFPVVSGETDWCWYTFVMSSDGIKAYEEAADDIPDISDIELKLSDRCLGRTVTGVTSLMIYGGTRTDSYGQRYKLSEAIGQEPDAIVTGDVKILPGYNMTLSNQDTMFDIEDADPTTISLNAVPGAGLGVIVCEESETTAGFATPGLLSTDGHARIFNDTCYDVSPYRYEISEGTLKIHAKCKACCTCEMYASIVNDRLVPLRDEILADRLSLNGTYEKYEDNVIKWNDRIASALPEDVVITTTCVPLDAAATDIKGGDVAGMMNRCGYSLLVRNDSFVTIKITFSDFSSNGHPFESQVSYMDSNNKPVVTPVDLEKKDETGIICSVTLPPGRSMNLNYFIRLNNMVKTDSQSGFMSQIRVSAFQDDRKILSEIKRLSV